MQFGEGVHQAVAIAGTHRFAPLPRLALDELEHRQTVSGTETDNYPIVDGRHRRYDEVEPAVDVKGQRGSIGGLKAKEGGVGVGS
jgi:hypothetical protein